MSATRQAIVDALDTVTGVTGHLSIPDTPAAGDGWPVWESGAFRFGKLTQPIVHTYSAFVLLPAGYTPDVVDAGDSLVEQLMHALNKVGTVDVAEPVLVPVDNTSTMPAIRVRVAADPI